VQVKSDQIRQSGKRKFGLRYFSRDDAGSVVVEFAVLAIPFSLLVFAILESCISFAGNQLLMNATDEVARELRTGQVRVRDLDKDEKKNIAFVRGKVCEKIEIIVSKGCPGLLVDLKSYSTFTEAADARIKFKNDDVDDSDFGVELGKSGTINQLRTFYRWPVMTDFLRKSMSNLKGGNTLHFASVTWQNEPFDD